MPATCSMLRPGFRGPSAKPSKRPKLDKCCAWAASGCQCLGVSGLLVVGGAVGCNGQGFPALRRRGAWTSVGHCFVVWFRTLSMLDTCGSMAKAPATNKFSPGVLSQSLLLQASRVRNSKTQVPLSGTVQRRDGSQEQVLGHMTSWGMRGSHVAPGKVF